MIPLGQFIGGIKNYEHIPELFRSINADSTVPMFVDVKLGYLPYDARDREAKGLWMNYESGEEPMGECINKTLGHVDLLTSIFHSVAGMGDWLEQNRIHYQEKQLKDAASEALSRGVGPGSLKLAKSDLTSTWQVEIETKIGAKPKVSFLLTF